MGGVSGSGFVYDEQNSKISVRRFRNSGSLMDAGSLRVQSQNLVIGGILDLESEMFLELLKQNVGWIIRL